MNPTRTQLAAALRATLAAEGVEVCPCLVAKCIGEILSAARIVVRSRERSPAPRLMVVHPDLSEEPAA